jgi:hypothetical protein
MIAAALREGGRAGFCAVNSQQGVKSGSDAAIIIVRIAD